MDFFAKKKDSIDQKLSFFISKFMLTPYLGLPVFMLSAVLGINSKLETGMLGSILLFLIVHFSTYSIKKVPKYDIIEDKEILRKFYSFSKWVIAILGVLTIALAYSPMNKLKL